jgi:hypothetical protein
MSRPTNLNPNGAEEASMLGKQGTVESIYIMHDLQDSSVMVNATLCESQSPGTIPESVGVRMLETTPSNAGRVKVGSKSSITGERQPSLDGQCPVRAYKGTNGTPKADCYRPCKRNAGYPTGREAYGYGVLVVVVGVTTHQGVRNKPHTGRRGTG